LSHQAQAAAAQRLTKTSEGGGASSSSTSVRDKPTTISEVKIESDDDEQVGFD